MELKGDKIYLTELEQQNADINSVTVPLSAARIVAEQLLCETRADIARQDYMNGMLGHTIDDEKTMAIALPAWRKQEVARGLLDIADLELGMEQ